MKLAERIIIELSDKATDLSGVSSEVVAIIADEVEKYVKEEIASYHELIGGRNDRMFNDK